MGILLGLIFHRGLISSVTFSWGHLPRLKRALAASICVQALTSATSGTGRAAAGLLVDLLLGVFKQEVDLPFIAAGVIHPKLILGRVTADACLPLYADEPL